MKDHLRIVPGHEIGLWHTPWVVQEGQDRKSSFDFWWNWETIARCLTKKEAEAEVLRRKTIEILAGKQL